MTLVGGSGMLEVPPCQRDADGSRAGTGTSGP